MAGEKKKPAKKKRAKNYEEKLSIEGSLEDILKLAVKNADRYKSRKETINMAKTEKDDMTMEEVISLIYAMTEKIQAQLETIMEKEAEILSKLNSTSKGFEQEKMKKLLKEKKIG